MAYDGTLVFDTELDTTDFESGIQRLQDSAKGLGGILAALGGIERKRKKET